MDVNAGGRLHAVVSLEDTRPGNALRPPFSREGSRCDTFDPGEHSPPASDFEARQRLEQLCLRAEREGSPDAWLQVLPLIQARLRSFPNDAQALVFLGRAHAAKGKDGQNDALKAVHEALQLDPDIALGFMLDDLIARKCLRSREWETAVKHGEAALKAQPNDAECLEIVARASFYLERFDRAEICLSNLANINVDRSGKLASMFAKESKSAKQKYSWLKLAAAWVIGRERPLRELGEVCLVLERNEEAAQWFHKAIAQCPDDVEAISTLAQVHIRAGCIEEALEVYRVGARNLPDNYHLQRKFAKLLVQERRTSEAMDVIKRAVRLAPSSDAASLYVTLADLQQSVGEHAEALRTWEAAVALDETSIAAWRGLAIAGAALGNERAQLRALSQLSRLEPTNQEWPIKIQQLRDKSESQPGLNANPSALAGRSSQPEAETAPSPTAASGTDWRNSLAEGQELEVYSKSASKWLHSHVVQLSADMVKLKYLIDGHWCEKVLLRNSEMLRPRPGSTATKEAPSFSPTSRVQASSPASDAAQQRAWTKPAEPPLVVAPSSRSLSTPSSQVPQRAEPASSVARDDPPRRQWTEPPSAPPQSSAKSKVIEEHPRRQWIESAPPERQQPQTRPSNRSGHPDLLNADELIFGNVLGSGGFGAVYRGTYRGEQVAIKKLHPMDGKISPMQLEEFKKEVGNLQALRHQRLVSFVGAAWHASANSLCLVLEFMPNGSLYDLLHQRRQPLTKSQRWNMAVQIAEGVDFLHGRSPPFVHRDLKSLNVVLDMEFNAKLCDFGLTQSMEKTHITRKENEGGSPRYMAPELFDSKGRITEKVDVWALGCLAVEVFVSRVPHEECNAIPQVMTKILVDRKLPFLDWTGVHAEIRSLAESAFVFDPRERTDAARFLEGLRRLQPLFC